MRVVLDLDSGTAQISGTLTRGYTGDTRAFRGTLDCWRCWRSSSPAWTGRPRTGSRLLVGADPGADIGGEAVSLTRSRPGTFGIHSGG